MDYRGGVSNFEIHSALTLSRIRFIGPFITGEPSATVSLSVAYPSTYISMSCEVFAEIDSNATSPSVNFELCENFSRDLGALPFHVGYAWRSLRNWREVGATIISDGTIDISDGTLTAHFSSLESVSIASIDSEQISRVFMSTITTLAKFGHNVACWWYLWPDKGGEDIKGLYSRLFCFSINAPTQSWTTSNTNTCSSMEDQLT